VLGWSAPSPDFLALERMSAGERLRGRARNLQIEVICVGMLTGRPALAGACQFHLQRCQCHAGPPKATTGSHGGDVLSFWLAVALHV
jgi:hypothetical protein